MSCSSSKLGLIETNDEEQINKNLICSIPVLIKGQDEIVPVDLNLSDDNRTALTRIIKVQFFYSLTITISSFSFQIGYASQIQNGLIIINIFSHSFLFLHFIALFFFFFLNILLSSNK